jgi:hypothetical protein
MTVLNDIGNLSHLVPPPQVCDSLVLLPAGAPRIIVFLLAAVVLAVVILFAVLVSATASSGSLVSLGVSPSCPASSLAASASGGCGGHAPDLRDLLLLVRVLPLRIAVLANLTHAASVIAANSRKQ